LQYHLRLCPGLEEGKTTLNDYRANLRKLIKYLKGQRGQIIKQIESEMKTASKSMDFEKATVLRNQLFTINSLARQSIFYDSEAYDISKDRGLQGLSELLGLAKLPRRIEGYDISHMQGTDNVASMVVFKNGVPDKSAYRKFNMKLQGNNDFAHIAEVITRRLSAKNIKDWGLPDLFLIDGGKGQLSAALEVRSRIGVSLPMIGLAKREEEIVVSLSDEFIKVDENYLISNHIFYKKNEGYLMILLPTTSDIIKLLQRIRDESHRFAVSYHSILKIKRQKSSALDTVPGIGPITRKKLLKKFGSKQGISNASDDELIEIIGKMRMENIRRNLV
jgi:excinuclease ABC subunit C